MDCLIPLQLNNHCEIQNGNEAPDIETEAVVDAEKEEDIEN